MTNARAAALLAAGFAIGAAVAGFNLRGTAPDPRPESDPPATAASEHLPPACSDAPELAARAQILDRMAKEAEALFTANLEAHFLPPRNLPARFGGREIEHTLKGSIDAAGVKAELLGTDCSEYPCVTTARAHSAEDLQKIKDQFFEQAAYVGDIKQLARAKADGPTDYRFGATIYPATDPRRGEIFAALTRRLGAARLGPGAPHPELPPFVPDTIGSNQAPPTATKSP
jgi:hypothetical protein